MRIQTVHAIAGLIAALSFMLAFISAGVALLSWLFALIGAFAIAWLVYGVAKRVLIGRQPRDVTPI